MPTHRAATYPGEKPSASTVASVEVDPLDPTTSDPVDASGGGYAGASGSAFEHLTEDADNGSIYSDFALVLGIWDPVDGHADRSEPHIELNPGSKIRMGSGNGTLSEFEILQDGSLHWGGGTASPDAHIRREVVGGKIQLIATVGSTEVVLATEP